MSKNADTAATAAPKREDLPPIVLGFSDIFVKEHKISDTGAISLPDDTYAKTLTGTNLTMDIIAEFQKHNSSVQAGLALAAAEVGDRFCKKHKDINDVTVELKVGKDTMGSVYSATKQVTIPGNPVTTKEKHGVLRSYYEVHSTGANRGALKKVRDYVSAKAEAAAAA